MTVGITFSNGLEAVVCTDIRASTGGRESDSFKKLEKVESEKYHGVIFGCGSGNVIEGIFKKMPSSSQKHNKIEDFINAVKEELYSGFYDAKEQYIKKTKKEIEIKSGLFTNEDEKMQFTRSNISECIHNYNGMQNSTVIFITIYDKGANRIRNFYINEGGTGEVYANITAIGSGTDGANMYFSQKMQGVDEKKLKKKDIFFATMNSYNWATINQGVGGTPRVALIDKDGVRLFTNEEASTSTNVSGAYLAELIDKKYALGAMESIIGKAADYEEIARKLDLTQKALMSAAIPASFWQHLANKDYHD